MSKEYPKAYGPNGHPLWCVHTHDVVRVRSEPVEAVSPAEAIRKVNEALASGNPDIHKREFLAGVECDPEQPLGRAISTEYAEEVVTFMVDRLLEVPEDERAAIVTQHEGYYPLAGKWMPDLDNPEGFFEPDGSPSPKTPHDKRLAAEAADQALHIQNLSARTAFYEGLEVVIPEFKEARQIVGCMVTPNAQSQSAFIALSKNRRQISVVALNKTKRNVHIDFNFKEDMGSTNTLQLHQIAIAPLPMDWYGLTGCISCALVRKGRNLKVVLMPMIFNYGEEIPTVGLGKDVMIPVPKGMDAFSDDLVVSFMPMPIRKGKRTPAFIKIADKNHVSSICIIPEDADVLHGYMGVDPVSNWIPKNVSEFFQWWKLIYEGECLAPEVYDMERLS